MLVSVVKDMVSNLVFFHGYFSSMFVSEDHSNIVNLWFKGIFNKLKPDVKELYVNAWSVVLKLITIGYLGAEYG